MTTVFTISIVMLLGWFITDKVFPDNEENKEFSLLSQKHSLMCKAVAQLMIICQHAGHSRLFTPLGGGGVAIFLILSGYGLSESYKRDVHKSFKSYWIRKIGRTFIPYAIIETLFSWKISYQNVAEYVLDVTGINPRFWFINIILISYIVFSLFYMAPKLYRFRYVILTIYALGLFFFGSALHAEQALSFLIGVIISDNNKIKCMIAKNTSMILFAFIAIASLCAKQLPMLRAVEDTYCWYIMQLFLKTSMALFVISSTYLCLRKCFNRFVEVIGSISYELYLVHSEALFILGITSIVPIAAVIFIVFSIVVAMIFNKLNVFVDKKIKCLCEVI